MEKPNTTVWQRDTCQITEHVSLRLWHSSGRPHTYRSSLLWQDAPGMPRTEIYRRYLTAKDLYSARKAAFASTRRWLSKLPIIPDSLSAKDWEEVLTALSENTYE